jgi:hypothetical protein
VQATIRRVYDHLRWRLDRRRGWLWKVDKRLIFTATAGRTGTGYLTTLLDEFPGVSARHEPDPQFSLVLREVQRDPEMAERFWTRARLPMIRRARGEIYAETSHLICEGFLEALFDHGITPDLVLLERDPIDTATSFFQIASIPARTHMGNRFQLRPDDPGVLQLPGWEELDDWSLCYWYCREIERRMAHYAGEVTARGGVVLRTSLTTLKSDDGLRDLVTFVGTGTFPSLATRLRAAAGRVVNAKTGEKEDFARPLNFDRAERARVVDERLAASN